MSISRSNFWKSVRLEPILMIPNNPSSSSTTNAEFNLRFSPASRSINSVFSSHLTALSVIPLRSISLSFMFQSRTLPVSATTPKQRVNAKSSSYITEMLCLADRSLRSIILSKLAPSIPLLFCPGYAEAIQDRFKLLGSVVVPSIVNILRRRQSRIHSQEMNNPEPETILRDLWTVMTTSLNRKYLGSMVLDQFLDINALASVAIHTNTMLSEASSTINSEFGLTFSSDAMLSLSSEPKLVDLFSDDMLLSSFDEVDEMDRGDEILQVMYSDQWLYDSCDDDVDD
ncbi:hypothetical protein V1509DRAFT_628288 [Lipomyces kononenkoae]